MAVAGSGWGLAQLAEALGSSEQALRLIVSILMGSLEAKTNSACRLLFNSVVHREGELLRIWGSPSVFSRSTAAVFLPRSALPEGAGTEEFGRLGAAAQGPSAARSGDSSPVASAW